MRDYLRLHSRLCLCFNSCVFACLDNGRKSISCCFDPDFLDFVVNVLAQTSNNERTEDNFQGSFHDTESEEASDKKAMTIIIAKTTTLRTTTLVTKISCGRRRTLRKISALEFTILFRGPTTKEKLGKEDCIQKAGTYYFPKPCYKKEVWERTKKLRQSGRNMA